MPGYFHLFILITKSPGIALGFTLSKLERLKSRKTIELLFSKGKYFSGFPLKTIYLFTENGPGILEAGFGSSVKNFKKAVQRNRIKRLMKECYRLNKKPLEAELAAKNKSLAVFFIFTGKEIPVYQTVCENFDVALKKLEKMVHESTASNA